MKCLKDVVVTDMNGRDISPSATNTDSTLDGANRTDNCADRKRRNDKYDDKIKQKREKTSTVYTTNNNHHISTKNNLSPADDVNGIGTDEMKNSSRKSSPVRD